MSRSCLIIGGTGGFVGSAISQVAGGVGWEVTSVGRSQYADYVGQRFDVVINANGNSSRFRANKDPKFDFEASAVSVFQSLSDFDYGHYVLISTVDVYDDTTRLESTSESAPIDMTILCNYGFHKRLAEILVMRSCESWQVFRLAQMVGDGLKKGPIHDLIRGRPLWIDEATELHYMNTLHVAQAVCALVDNGRNNDVYNVCGRGQVEFRRIIELMPPSRQNVTHAGNQRQVYRINTDKTHAVYPLPESWNEVRHFVEGALAESR